MENKQCNSILMAYVHDELPKLAKPFLCDDFIVATNGHIACRIKKFNGCDDYEPGFIKTANTVFSITPPLEQPIIFNTSDLQVFDAETLLSLTSQLSDCDTCNGSGTCNECGCGNSHDCGDCDGEGSQVSPPTHCAMFMGQSYTYAYLQKIFDTANLLNGGEFKVVGKSGNNKYPLLVKIKDFEIALMPCRKDSGIQIEKRKENCQTTAAD